MSRDVDLLIDKHAKFLLRTLQGITSIENDSVLPGSSASYDNQRITIAYFAISGLDILDRLNLIDDMREDIIGWVYNLLINRDTDDTSRCGFRGSSTFKLESGDHPTHLHDYGHIAMTYTALAILVILGDDLSRIDRESLCAGLRSLQLSDGSFKAAAEGGENDMRFIYCAAAISTFLNSKSGIDTEKAIDYIVNSISTKVDLGKGPG